MKRAGLVLALCVCSVASGQTPLLETISDPSPRITIHQPLPLHRFRGEFVLAVENWDYLPGLATSASREYAVGVDANGDPIRPNEGHLHGWVQRIDWWTLLPRDEPAYRFYGAGGANWYQLEPGLGVYTKADIIEPGLYLATFEAQRSDHTGATRATARSLPASATVMFWVP